MKLFILMHSIIIVQNTSFEIVMFRASKHFCKKPYYVAHNNNEVEFSKVNDVKH